MTAFVTVAEHRSFADAARRLAISPSAATRLVAALEQRLGIRLLQRTTRSVTLTDAGARYLESARRILAAVDDAESSARAEVAVPTGRFVVAAPLVFGRREVAPLFSDFLARWPEVTGELVLADRVVNLLEEGIDVAVRIGVLADSSLRVRPLGKTRRVLVASPEYLERRKVPRRPRDLERHARAPQVFVQTSASGQRLGIQVVAVRAIETGDRLETWRLGPDGLLREVRELAASPGVDVLTSAADPWGGGLVVYTREETSQGAARVGGGGIGFFSRVCP